MKYDLDISDDASGGRHLKWRILFYGRLVGDETGPKYEASQVFTWLENVAPGETPKTIHETVDLLPAVNGEDSHIGSCRFATGAARPDRWGATLPVLLSRHGIRS